MLTRIKQTLQRLKKHEPGERFGAFYREQKDKPLGVKIAFFGLAFVSFGIGVVLAFIPGPAVLFFALTGALLSTQSRFIAERLDKAEVWGRKTLASIRAWWHRKRHKPNGRATTRKTGHARG
ncbi:MAG TPA: hypothetical protein VMS65_04990 [Polyangiaceae bacterium]|nr:hypothetical protein [Polyangiaceae bacterium]